MGSLRWRLSFWFDEERPGVYLNTQWWSRPINFCAAKVLILLSFFSHLFPSSSGMPRPLAYRHCLFLSYRYCMVVLKTCNEVLFFISVMPSELRRFEFALIWLCDDNTVADNLRRKIFSTSRYDSPLSGLSTDYSFQRDCLPLIGRQFADGDGYRSKEPIIVSKLHFPFSPRDSFLCGNGAPLFFTCFDVVVLL
jgi:hypothetical protein